MNNRILVANIGSTSFKFRLIEMPGASIGPFPPADAPMAAIARA